MKQFLFAVTSLLILSSASYGQSKWWVSADSVNIFTRNTGGVMIGGVDPLGKLTVNSDRLGFNLALVGDYNNLSKNYLKIGVLGRASNGLDGHTLFDLYHSNQSLKKAGFNFRINEKSAFFINGEGNIGIGTEKPLAGLDITSGPDWGGFKKGLRLSANNAISVESGEMKYGMVGSENALHFFATNGGEKVNPFGSAFAKLMSLQPKKVVIEGDLEVKGKIIYEGGQFNGGGSTTGGSNTGGSSTGTGTSDDGGVKGGGFGEVVGEIIDKPWRGSDIDYNVFWETGNVGIGTTTPAYKFDLNGTARFQGGNVTFPGNGTWTSTGKVGIGVSSNLSSQLEIGPVSSSNGGNIKLHMGSSYSESSFNIENISNRMRFYYQDVEIPGNSKEVMSLLNNGNVGIGIITPESPLHVGIGPIQIGSASNGKWSLIGTNVAFAIHDKDLNQYRLWVDNNNGNVGVNVSAQPTSKFYIKGSGTTSSTSSLNIVNSSNNSMFFVRDDGNVGIGTASPGNKLDVSGTARFLNGDVTFPGSGVWKNTTGYVGIGISSPSEKLHVVGNIQSATNDVNHSFALLNSTNDKAWRMIQLNSSDSQSPNGLIFEHQIASGNVVRYLTLTQSGNVGIGTTNPGTCQLAVEGKIGARQVVVTQTNPWPDFVFADDYKLMPLNQLEKHVKANKHLPGIPTEKDVTSNGVDLGEVQAKLLQKVEELTLYVIEMNKKIEMQDKKIREQDKEIKRLKK